MKSLKIKKSITDRSNIPLNDYLKEINKIPLLTKEEEVEVATAANKGDKDALEKLIVSNLRFVVSCVKQYQGQGLSLSDLISEGNIGLIKAANRFDVSKGYKFISYAVWWIRQSVLQALSEQSRTIRLPMNQINNSTKIIKAILEFEQKYERKPSNIELEEITNISADKIDKILNSNNKTISLDTPLDVDEENTLIEVIPNNNVPKTDKNLMEESKRDEVQQILNLLDNREHDIICMFFGIGSKQLTLEQIGNKFGITNERARQIKEKAILKLRTNYKDFIKHLIQ